MGPSSIEMPEDMERRRLADIEKYILEHPEQEHLFVAPLNRALPARSGVPTSVSTNRKRKDSGTLAVVSCGPKLDRKSGQTGNHWDLDTTLELLEGMKNFVRQTGLTGPIGGDQTRWKAIACQLSNPYKIELSKYARSCQVRYENIVRFLRGKGKLKKARNIPGRVRESVEEYCGLINTPRLCSRELSPPARVQELELRGELEIVDIKPIAAYEVTVNQAILSLREY